METFVDTSSLFVSYILTMATTLVMLAGVICVQNADDSRRLGQLAEAVGQEARLAQRILRLITPPLPAPYMAVIESCANFGLRPNFSTSIKEVEAVRLTPDMVKAPELETEAPLAEVVDIQAAVA